MNPTETPLERLLSKLPGAKKSGTEWTARCPAHADDVPSLQVRETLDGVLLVHCWAGCETGTVLAAVGLTFRDLYPAERARPVEVRRWSIRAPDGQVVAVLARREPGPFGRRKQYLWYGPNGRSKGLGGRPLASLPLYGCERLNGDPVVLCEGPKAADAVTDAGFCGLGTVTGAGATPGIEAFRVLIGHDVVLWPDFDAEGIRHMRRISEALPMGVGSVSVVVAESGWGAGSDAADFDAADRRLLIGRARLLRPMRSQEEGDGDSHVWAAFPPCVTSPKGIIGDDAPEFRYAPPTRAELRILTEAYARLRGKPVSVKQTGLLRGCHQVHGPATVDLMDGLWRQRGTVLDLLRDLRHLTPAEAGRLILGRAA